MVCAVNEQRSSVVFEVAYKYCISDSFVDYDAHSISSKGFLPTGAMLSEFLFQFSVDGWGYVLSLLLSSGETMVEVVKIMAASFRFPCMHCCTQCPQPCIRPNQPTSPLPETPGHARASLGQSLVGHCSFLLVHKVLFVPSQSQFPQSCVSSGSSMVG